MNVRAKPKKKAAKRTAKKTAKKAAPLVRVILQFTRNRRNNGRPQLAPQGANDLHLVWKFIPGGGLITGGWWTRNGRKIKAIKVPRGSNDAHLRIR